MMKQSKKMILLLLAVLYVFSLFGCMPQAEYAPALPESTASAPPVDKDEDWMFETALYFSSADRRALVAQERTVYVEHDESGEEAALRALCDGPQSKEVQLMGVIPDTLTLSRVAFSGNVCQVYFEGRMPYMDAEENGLILLIMRAAIAATVAHASDYVRYIDVYINGRQPGFRGRPMGVLAPIEVALDTYLANITRQDYSVPTLSGSEVRPYDNRNALLFFKDITGQYLLCDVRPLYYERHAESTNVISALVGELLKGPLESEEREPVLPPDMRLVKCRFLPVPDGLPQETNAPGKTAVPTAVEPQISPGDPCILELYMLKPDEAYDEALAYASLVYTTSCFWPNVEAVRIILLEKDVVNEKGMLIEQLIDKKTVKETMYTREDVYARLGQIAPLYFPDKNGLGLYNVNGSFAQGNVYDAMTRLQALFAGGADLGVRFDFLTAHDILSVTRQDDMMVVDFRQGFLEKFQSFVEEGLSPLPKKARARMFVYSIVDTLCTLPGVQSVWMLENGERIMKTVDMTYLGNALFYNPGLILD